MPRPAGQRAKQPKDDPMPEVTTNPPRIAVTVAGVKLTAPAPFAPGYILTPGDAAFLNRAVASAVANPHATVTAKNLKAGTPIPDAETLQTQYDTRYAAFVLGESNRGGSSVGQPTDPLARMVNFLATEKLKALIVSKGRKVSEFHKDKDADGVSAWTKNLKTLMDRDSELFTAQATAQIAALAGDADLELT